MATGRSKSCVAVAWISKPDFAKPVILAKAIVINSASKSALHVTTRPQLKIVETESHAQLTFDSQ
jgi:hypothetical protein